MYEMNIKGITVSLNFGNYDEFKELLEKAEHDMETLKTDVENIRNFKIRIQTTDKEGTGQ